MTDASAQLPKRTTLANRMPLFVPVKAGFLHFTAAKNENSQKMSS
jgi:hypothetical protein